MNALRKSLAIAGVAVTGLLATATASATPFIITLTQQGGNVVATGSGAIDLTGFDTYGVTGTGPNGGGAGINPDVGAISVGPSANIDGYRTPVGTFYGPQSFGAGGYSPSTTSFGDFVLFQQLRSASLQVPAGYSSDAALSGSATWDNATFASLGVTPGIYVWSWGSAPDQSFTLDISVPEPSALALFGGGLLLLGAFVGLRRKRAA